MKASDDEIQFRYRRASLEDFASYHDFLQAANLIGIVGDSESFLASLEAAPRKQIGKL